MLRRAATGQEILNELILARLDVMQTGKTADFDLPTGIGLGLQGAIGMPAD